MCAIMTPESFEYGSVGVPMACAEVKLVDVADAGYFANNKPSQGEIWLRGPSISKGYYNRDKETEEAFTEDGWFKTGDVGQWEPSGTVKIIDRKKNLVKTLNGEYIALEKVCYSTTFFGNLLMSVSWNHCIALVILSRISSFMRINRNLNQWLLSSPPNQHLRSLLPRKVLDPKTPSLKISFITANLKALSIKNYWLLENAVVWVVSNLSLEWSSSPKNGLLKMYISHNALCEYDIRY